MHRFHLLPRNARSEMALYEAPHLKASDRVKLDKARLLLKLRDDPHPWRRARMRAYSGGQTSQASLPVMGHLPLTLGLLHATALCRTSLGRFQTYSVTGQPTMMPQRRGQKPIPHDNGGAAPQFKAMPATAPTAADRRKIPATHRPGAGCTGVPCSTGSRRGTASAAH